MTDVCQSAGENHALCGITRHSEWTLVTYGEYESSLQWRFMKCQTLFTKPYSYTIHITSQTWYSGNSISINIHTVWHTCQQTKPFFSSSKLSTKCPTTKYMTAIENLIRSVTQWVNICKKGINKKIKKTLQVYYSFVKKQDLKFILSIIVCYSF